MHMNKRLNNDDHILSPTSKKELETRIDFVDSIKINDY